MTKFKDVFLGNLLIVVALIPMVLLLNSLMSAYDNVIFWIILSSILLCVVSYLQYRHQKEDEYLRKYNGN